MCVTHWRDPLQRHYTFPSPLKVRKWSNTISSWSTFYDWWSFANSSIYIYIFLIDLEVIIFSLKLNIRSLGLKTCLKKELSRYRIEWEAPALGTCINLFIGAPPSIQQEWLDKRERCVWNRPNFLIPWAITSRRPVPLWRALRASTWCIFINLVMVSVINLWERA